jgi:formylglycine-generating enzyme required for sulfatase activity
VTPRKRVAAAALVIAALGGGALVVAMREPVEALRCGPDFVEMGWRCCRPGQTLEGGHCAGVPTKCSETPRPSSEETILMCRTPADHLLIAGGAVELAPLDWEAAGQVRSRRIEVAPFRIGQFEITARRWQACVDAKMCRALEDASEPERPVVSVTAAEAAGFCAFDHGALPTSDQWVFAAAGAAGRRYPWGETGAVCRRAVFGIASGPCAAGGDGPDLAGTRADGASPEGVYDLAGNVAEWTIAADGSAEARGGSWADTAAAALRSWSARLPAAGSAAPDIGFRCVYPP